MKLSTKQTDKTNITSFKHSKQVIPQSTYEFKMETCNSSCCN